MKRRIFLALLALASLTGCAGLEYSNDNGPRGPERLKIGGFLERGPCAEKPKP